MAAHDAGRKNVVLILADDLDWDLWDAVPRLSALKQQGVTFENHVVTESLCCPSRASILRGQYVHNHRVISNDAITGGGWPTYRDAGYPGDSLPAWLQAAGVRTGLVGKYLNEFPQERAEARRPLEGWSYYAVPVSHAAAYRGYDYRLSVNGQITRHAAGPDDFLNDVLDTQATDFLARSPEPFFLDVSTFVPHLPAPVAMRHKGSHSPSQAPRDTGFDAPVTNGPSWIADVPPLSGTQVARLDDLWRTRAASAESFADTVDAVLRGLARTGHADDTLVLVTSDNGFHLGQHRLPPGKRTAFDHDTRVPLVVLGSDLPPGTTVDAMTSMVDVAPTIGAAMGAPIPEWVDGRSFLPLLSEQQDDASGHTGWRSAVLTESIGTVTAGDPDFQPLAPPPFAALRTARLLYVRYDTGERELYDRIEDPNETRNLIAEIDAEALAALDHQLDALRSCAGPTCRAADIGPAQALPGRASR